MMHPTRAATTAILILSLGLPLVPEPSSGAEGAPLQAEMRRLELPSVLLIPSQAVDEQPVWAPRGDAVAANVEGRWVRVSLIGLSLASAAWHGKDPIAVVTPPARMLPISEEAVRDWLKTARSDPARVVTHEGTTVELRPEELGTAFVITKKRQAPELLWRTGLEACHSLALSPDEKYVAFICELTGVIVTALR